MLQTLINIPANRLLQIVVLLTGTLLPGAGMVLATSLSEHIAGNVVLWIIFALMLSLPTLLLNLLPVSIILLITRNWVESNDFIRYLPRKLKNRDQVIEERQQEQRDLKAAETWNALFWAAAANALPMYVSLLAHIIGSSSARATLFWGLGGEVMALAVIAFAGYKIVTAPSADDGMSDFVHRRPSRHLQTP